jgi:hypothetical protein
VVVPAAPVDAPVPGVPGVPPIVPPAVPVLSAGAIPGAVVPAAPVEAPIAGALAALSAAALLPLLHAPTRSAPQKRRVARFIVVDPSEFGDRRPPSA